MVADLQILGLGIVMTGISSLGTYGLSLTVLLYLRPSWFQKPFRPPVQPGYDDKYRSRTEWNVGKIPIAREGQLLLVRRC